MLSDRDINTRNETLEVIGKLRDERTVKPVVRCFVEFQTTWHGERALKDLGPIAEKEVLALLNQPDKGLWVPAIRVLKEIGTQKSIPTLEAAARGEISLQSRRSHRRHQCADPEVAHWTPEPFSTPSASRMASRQ
jgi:HEAT repeat protein